MSVIYIWLAPLNRASWGDGNINIYIYILYIYYIIYILYISYIQIHISYIYIIYICSIDGLEWIGIGSLTGS